MHLARESVFVRLLRRVAGSVYRYPRLWFYPQGVERLEAASIRSTGSTDIRLSFRDKANGEPHVQGKTACT